MSQPLQNINLIAPGFKGINTEDSPIAQDPSFAEIADNAIIDKRGRIASRKGFLLSTEDKTELGSSRISKVHHFYNSSGSANDVIFCTGNNKIMAEEDVSGTLTLVDKTPAGYPTPTGDNWRIVNFNEACYFFQRSHEPLIYTVAGGLETFGTYTGTTTSTSLYCHEALSAWGRLWVTDSSGDAQTIYWSDLLIGTDFSGGSSGSIDVSKAWPEGFDKIRGLAAHNNLLIVFGDHSILVYQGADSPATMALADTVSGVGLVCRNSIQYTGTDVLFMSYSGLRSFGRVIQEKSMPISDLSANVKTELLDAEIARTEPTASVYSPENNFYLLSFPNLNLTYCFDTRVRLENGSFRVTKWPSVYFKAFERKSDGTLLIGNAEGLGEYSDFYDNGTSYRFRYYSPSLTFGDPSKLKILKKIKPTIVGASGASVNMKWGYDFSNSYSSRTITISSQSVPARYGISQYLLSYYTTGISTSREQFNSTGNGSVISIGLEADIIGTQLSVQEIAVFALIGKTL